MLLFKTVFRKFSKLSLRVTKEEKLEKISALLITPITDTRKDRKIVNPIANRGRRKTCSIFSNCKLTRNIDTPQIRKVSKICGCGLRRISLSKKLILDTGSSIWVYSIKVSGGTKNSYDPRKVKTIDVMINAIETTEKLAEASLLMKSPISDNICDWVPIMD